MIVQLLTSKAEDRLRIQAARQISREQLDGEIGCWMEQESLHYLCIQL